MFNLEIGLTGELNFPVSFCSGINNVAVAVKHHLGICINGLFYNAIGTCNGGRLHNVIPVPEVIIQKYG